MKSGARVEDINKSVQDKRNNVMFAVEVKKERDSTHEMTSASSTKPKTYHVDVNLPFYY